VQPTFAGCKSDCADEYQSAKEDCNNRYDEPDDADDLTACLNDAKTAYDDCMDECDN
jgi:hypothetical protein